MSRPDRALLNELDRRLPNDERSKVVVLGGPRSTWLFRSLTGGRPSAVVLRYNPATMTRSQLHVSLAGHGPFDVIVDATRQKPGRARRLRDVFFHLRPGGVLVARTANDLLPLVARLVELKAGDGPEPETQAARDLQSLAAATGEVTVAARHVVLQNRVNGFAKLREHEVDSIIELLGEELGRVLERRPPVEFASRCVVRESSSERTSGMPAVYDVPAVSLREYSDVVCAPGQVVTRDHLLLPDSYRHNQTPRLKNLYTEELAPLFARPRGDLSGAEPLAGPHFYLDSEFRGHFGHAMTEVLSRLWAWPEAKRAEPRLKAVMAVNKGRELAAFEIALFQAAGIDPDDLVLVRGPVRVERLLAATPMFSMPAYVHPELSATWARVGRNLAAAAPSRAYPARVFCSRGEGKRACHNAREVEDLFSAHGFEVIFPERYSLAEQAAIFREAEVVGGYAGSGLFTLCLAESPKRVVMLTQEAYRGRNEYMIAAVLGHEIDLVTSRPDPSWTGYPWEAGFTVDFDREGSYLKQVLASL